MALELVGGGGRVALDEDDDGAAQPGAGEEPVGGEAALDGQPGVGEEVEALEEAALGTGVEVGGAPRGIRLGMAHCGRGAARGALDDAALLPALVGVTDDGGEIAVADAGLAAAGVGAEAALGVVEVVERVAAKGADEGLARAGHGVLGVHSLEKEACGAVLGVGLVPLLLDDGAEHVGVLSVERMAEMPAAGDIHAQEGRDECQQSAETA